jgi:hypothetical protein
MEHGNGKSEEINEAVLVMCIVYISPLNGWWGWEM